jgi:hypothetical protein
LALAAAEIGARVGTGLGSSRHRASTLACANGLAQPFGPGHV